jgi:hypothetical protein
MHTSTVWPTEEIWGNVHEEQHANLNAGQI